MDPDKTAPFELGAGDDLLLLFHGFTGSTWDLLPLAQAVASPELRVRAVRLPGHGRSPEALTAVTSRDWLAAAEEAVLAANARRVILGGLSMGALLCLHAAAQLPERVTGLILMAPAMRFAHRRFELLRLTRHVPLPLLELLSPWVNKNATDIEDAEVRAQAPVLPRFPSARLSDLWAVQDRARAALPRVRAPALVAMALKDNVVSVEGGRELARGLVQAPWVRLVTIAEGCHIIPRDCGQRALFVEARAFLSRLATPSR